MAARLIIVFVIVGLVPLVASPAAAQSDSHAVTWPEDARRFDTWQVTALAFLAAGTYGLNVFIEPTETSVSGGVLFDDGIRDGLRLSDRSARESASTLSDYLALALVAYPFVDTAAVAVFQDGEDAAGQMLSINAFAFMSMAFLNSLSKNLVARARPLAQECLDDPIYSPHCGHAERNRSFFSGHAGNAFTAASLTCLHHSALENYGGAGDVVACVTSMALATTVGVLRVLADRHYLTDVLVGAALGIAVGFLAPAAIHNL